jgi:glycosyltransferase involved in cell wall biosynthesis
MERRTLDAVDLGIGGNEAAAHELQRKGVGTVRVLPQLGLDPEWFCRADGPKSDAFTVGYVGRFVPEKGVDLLLRAAAGLDGVWKVRLLGAGPEEKTLQNLAVQLGIQDRVELLPGVPHAEVADFLRTLDVLVLPSLTAKGWAEQFGHVLIEAMSTELPVVASQSGSIPEVVGEAGVLFPEGDVSALRGVLAELRENREWAERLGRKGRDRVLQLFSSEKIAARTLELYQLLLSDNTSMSTPENSISVDRGLR